MSKFNTKQEGAAKGSSHEGAVLYQKDPIEDWINFLFSSYLEDGYYTDTNTRQEEFLKLTEQVYNTHGAEFIAKAAVFSRNELGLRSVAQLMAAWLNNRSFENKRGFFRNFCHRPDDVAEIFAAIDMLGNKRSHAAVRGCGDYLSRLNEYSIGKYKLNGKNYNMFDLINITHATSYAINKYKDGSLATPDTWEVNISTAKSAEDRNQEWKRLVQEGGLGYLALIRNLRNISAVEDFFEIESTLIQQLTNETAIKRSLVMPYQIYTAYRYSRQHVSLQVEAALERAFKIACGNMPKLPGKSIIILDVSGSMDGCLSSNSVVSIKEAGACYATALFFSQNADFIKFGNRALSCSFKLAQSPFEVIKRMCENDDCGYGTDIEVAFCELLGRGQAYDRVFIISDIQTMSSRHYWYRCSDVEPRDLFKKCAKRWNKPDAHCYSFDLGNYHTQIDNPDNENVHLLTALNDKVFDMLKYIEDGSSLVEYINSLTY